MNSTPAPDPDGPRLPPRLPPPPSAVPPPVTFHTPTSPVLPIGPDPTSTAAVTAARRARRKRRLTAWGLLLAGALTFGVIRAIGGTSSNGGSKSERDTVTTWPKVAVPVTGEHFAFTMPGQPTSEPLEQTAAGLTLRGTAWSLHQGDELIEVMEMRFSEALTEEALQSAYTSMIEGMRSRANGVLATDEHIEWHGNPARRVKVTVPLAGDIYLEAYSDGQDILVVIAASTGRSAPAAYTATLASVTLVAGTAASSTSEG